jgi:MFS superfamily sulfate permease-like transporter
MNQGDTALREVDLHRWIPALRWLPAYDRSWLRGDLIAGLTLAAYLLPAAATTLRTGIKCPTCG